MPILHTASPRLPHNLRRLPVPRAEEAGGVRPAADNPAQRTGARSYEESSRTEREAKETAAWVSGYAKHNLHQFAIQSLAIRNAFATYLR